MMGASGLKISAHHCRPRRPGVFGAIDDASDRERGQKAGTHGAGLSVVEIAAIRRPCTTHRQRLADSEHFRVSGGIARTRFMRLRTAGEDPLPSMMTARRASPAAAASSARLQGDVHGEAVHLEGSSFPGRAKLGCCPPRVAPLPIRQLPEDLVNPHRRRRGGWSLRAGQELVENAIDAGAQRIIVTTAGGDAI